MNKKIIVSILGLLVVIGGGYYFFYQSQNANSVLIEKSQMVIPVVEKEDASVPSDWKTYRNDIRGYVISYPPSWYIEEIYEQYIRIASSPTSTNMHGTGLPSGVWVEVFDSSSTDPRSEAICQDTHGEYVSAQYAPNTKSKCYGGPMGGIEVSSYVYPNMKDEALLITLDKITNSFRMTSRTGEVFDHKGSSRFRVFPGGISTGTPPYLHFSQYPKKLILEEWGSQSIIKTFPDALATELEGSGEFSTQVWGGVMSPVDQNELFLSKTVFHTYYPHPCTFTRSFYVLDIKGDALTKFYEETEAGISEGSPRFCTEPVIFGLDGSKLLFWYHTPETGGRCDIPWVMKDGVYYLDLSNLSQDIKAYMVPEYLRLQGEKEMKLCQEFL